MSKNKNTPALRPLALATALLCLAAGAQAATIVVTGRDAAGIGFNDPTPVAPVGGNPGTTLGQQRWNVYQYVAGIWGNTLQSNVTITVNAGWEALSCDASSAVLGSASPWNYWRDFSGSKPSTWYPQALANKLSGENLSDGQEDDGSGYGNVDIKTQFNINLGNAGCFTGGGFYLGLDGNVPAGQTNFMETLLHELGHGLGFTVNPTSSQTGQRVNASYTAYSDSGLPSIWEQFMYDNTKQKTWLAMGTASADRKASGINTGNLSWNGPITVAEAAETLSHPQAIVAATPAQPAPSLFPFSPALFGATVGTSTNLGPVADSASQACTALPAATAAAVKGRVAIVDRGTCNFVIKAKMVQDAGAIGMIVVNNVAGALATMSGTDLTVTIPSVGLSQADGTALRAMAVAAKKYGSRSAPGTVYASGGVDMSKRAGMDAGGRPLLYAPNPYVVGSSVSHWDISAFPNLLMEPNINPDLTTTLSKPKDLTLPLLRDLGW